MGSHCSNQLQQLNEADLDQDESHDHTCEGAANYCFPEKKPMVSVSTKYQMLRQLQIPAQPTSPGSPVKALKETQYSHTSCPTRRNAILIKKWNETQITQRSVTSNQHRSTQEQNTTFQLIIKKQKDNNSPKILKEKRKQRSAKSVVTERDCFREDFRRKNHQQSLYQSKPKRQCLIMNSDQLLNKLFIQ